MIWQFLKSFVNEVTFGLSITCKHWTLVDALVKTVEQLENQKCYINQKPKVTFLIFQMFILFHPEVSLDSSLLWPMVRRGTHKSVKKDYQKCHNVGHFPFLLGKIVCHVLIWATHFI